MAPCKANFPTENNLVMLGISVDGLEFHLITGEKRTGEETVERFFWDKIKFWKCGDPENTFSFQYFFKSNQDTWITCETGQARLLPPPSCRIMNSSSPSTPNCLVSLYQRRDSEVRGRAEEGSESCRSHPPGQGMLFNLPL